MTRADVSFYDAFSKTVRSVISDFNRICNILKMHQQEQTMWWRNINERNKVFFDAANCFRTESAHLLDLVQSVNNSMLIHKICLTPELPSDSLYKLLKREAAEFMIISEQFIADSVAFLQNQSFTLLHFQDLQTKGMSHLTPLQEASNFLHGELVQRNLISPSTVTNPQVKDNSSRQTKIVDIDNVLSEFDNIANSLHNYLESDSVVSSNNTSNTSYEDSYEYEYEIPSVESSFKVDSVATRDSISSNTISQLTSEFSSVNNNRASRRERRMQRNSEVISQQHIEYPSEEYNVEETPIEEEYNVEEYTTEDTYDYPSAEYSDYNEYTGKDYTTKDTYDYPEVTESSPVVHYHTDDFVSVDDDYYYEEAYDETKTSPEDSVNDIQYSNETVEYVEEVQPQYENVIYETKDTQQVEIQKEEPKEDISSRNEESQELTEQDIHNNVAKKIPEIEKIARELLNTLVITTQSDNAASETLTVFVPAAQNFLSETRSLSSQLTVLKLKGLSTKLVATASAFVDHCRQYFLKVMEPEDLLSLKKSLTAFTDLLNSVENKKNRPPVPNAPPRRTLERSKTETERKRTFSTAIPRNRNPTFSARGGSRSTFMMSNARAQSVNKNITTSNPTPQEAPPKKPGNTREEHREKAVEEIFKSEKVFLTSLQKIIWVNI